MENDWTQERERIMAEEARLQEEDGPQRKSKSQVKREVEALQKLGEELMELPLARVKQMELPSGLMAALEDAQTITSNVARRRHRQYIGVLMRDLDPEPIRLAMARTAVPHFTPKVSPARVWVNRLMAEGNPAMEELLETCPALERQRLRQLVRNASKPKGKKAIKTLEDLISKEL
ncbi:MAG: DUF615 domain-containing protein [Desulfovibrionales bacterium]|nr:DUF615 domain-containing protein [Desulfovibrionales bacterium]